MKDITNKIEKTRQSLVETERVIFKEIIDFLKKYSEKDEDGDVYVAISPDLEGHSEINVPYAITGASRLTDEVGAIGAGIVKEAIRLICYNEARDEISVATESNQYIPLSSQIFEVISGIYGFLFLVENKLGVDVFRIYTEMENAAIITERTRETE